MRVVFMGTPDFAAEALKRIVEAGHEVTCVVTQPDKEKGRGKEVSFSPVKECALALNLPVFQPKKIRLPEEVEKLKQFPADIYVVAAFGQILSREILEYPQFGCVNIHASLLPKYRGASPIAWAVLNGEEETGVTIMQMAEGVDTGDILLQRAIPIDRKETTESLFDKLMVLGGELIVEALPLIEKGALTPIPQEEEKATKVGKMDKTFGCICWEESATQIERKVRGLYSWPSAYTFLNGKRVKLLSCEVAEDASFLKEMADKAKEATWGEVVSITKKSFFVKTGEGYLEVLELQPEGKKRMETKDYLLGNAIHVGDKFDQGE